MRGHHLCLLIALLSFSAYGAPPEAESFDLSVTLATPYNHDFTMLTTVRVGQPFELTATNGAITNKASGTLQAPVEGVYPLDLTVSEWKSETSNIRDTTQLKLELGKRWAGGPVSSFVYTRIVVLRRHEPAFKPSSRSPVPNHALQRTEAGGTPVLLSWSVLASLCR